jgi:hypothetical protein
MSSQQVPTKSPASVPVHGATRGGHHVTDREFAEWIKEVECDVAKEKISKGAEHPERMSDAKPREIGKA